MALSRPTFSTKSFLPDTQIAAADRCRDRLTPFQGPSAVQVMVARCGTKPRNHIKGSASASPQSLMTTVTGRNDTRPGALTRRPFLPSHSRKPSAARPTCARAAEALCHTANLAFGLDFLSPVTSSPRYFFCGQLRGAVTETPGLTRHVWRPAKTCTPYALLTPSLPEQTVSWRNFSKLHRAPNSAILLESCRPERI